jgi:ubiquinone/menaquinone biosynthesis C-methylase UbiE
MRTSWEGSHSWYDKTVGEKGHEYHQQLVLPGVLKLLNLQEGDSLLDLACGQGVLARNIPKKVGYLGVDASFSLIKEAKKKSGHNFIMADLTEPLKADTFSHAAIILALQNIEKPEIVLQNAADHLVTGGKCVIVLNHPCFRIPRQSSWGIDGTKKLQYRRVDRYMSDLKIPIQMHPGQEKSPTTWSFHTPLSKLMHHLHTAGFVIEILEEWCSGKKSTGAMARMENRARDEFPLFMAILTVKK